MFVVYENNKKLSQETFPYLFNPFTNKWVNCSFLTMEEAIDYAKEWVLLVTGDSSSIPYTWDGTPIHYMNGYAISIREE